MTEKASQQDRQELEEQLKRQAWKSISMGVPKILEAIPTAWKDDDLKLYQEEKALVLKHFERFEYTCAFVTIGMFGALRGIAHPQFRPFADRYLVPPILRLFQMKETPIRPPRKKRTNTNTNIPTKKRTTTTSQHSKREATFLEQQRDQRAQDLSSSMDIVTDAITATLFGVLSTVLWFWTQNQDFHQDFQKLPLTAGKSVVSDTLCPDFIQLVEDYNNHGDLALSRKEDDPDVRTIHQFAKHCQYRLENKKK